MSWNHIRTHDVCGRKQHRCDLCGLRIRKGAKHLSITASLDGTILTVHRHACCDRATWMWDDMDWETSCDEATFRRYELGLPLISLEAMI